MGDEEPVRKKLPELVRKIVESYSRTPHTNHLTGAVLPDRERIAKIIRTTLVVLYPGYFGEKTLDESNVEFHIGTEVDRLHDLLSEEIARAIEYECRRLEVSAPLVRGRGEEVAVEFISRIPGIRELLALDVQAAYDGDPAAKSLDEVIFCYPGLYAVSVYRIAHELHKLGVPLIPRFMTEHAHGLTGIDIHPGAQIGKSFFIDHGTGVVIGETSEIGNWVKIYQGVTLGALSFPTDAEGKLVRGTKRHPTIEDRVVIYANATVLGGETVIGHDAVIGSSTWITRPVAPHTTVMMEKPKLRVRGEHPDE